MASASLGAAVFQVHRLFDEGSVAALPDGQLLERFVASRDERAFETLVTRHGPMVLATCRAVLGDRHASEDAFQSAFALLVRRASSLRDAEALGGWLHRVAYREAIRLGAEAARRRAVERDAPPPTRAERDHPDELRAIVHAELDRLPESLRLPVVLCDLEGLTKDRAAQHLGWTEATVRGRLERARRLLRTRLARRGLGASAAWLVGSMAGEASASVGPRLAASAVRSASTVVPAVARVAGWVKVAATLAGIGLVGLAGLGWPGAESPVATAPPPAPEVAAVVVPLEDDDPAAPVEVVGRVVDPDGKPVAGAKVRLQVSPTALPREPEPTTTSDADGRFSIRGPRWAFPVKGPWWGPQVVASAPGSGVGLAFAGHVIDTPGEVTVRLVADDVPIEGRVVDLEGRPVAGATVRVWDVFLPTGPDLSNWLDKARRFGVRGPWEGLNTRDLESIPDLPEAATTAGPDGRFRVVGVGRERIAALLISGPGIATAKVFAMTRTGPAIRTADRGRGEPSLTFHAGRFEHVAGPSRPVEGVVTDQDTGAPLPGLKVEGMVFDEDSSIAAPGVGATTGPDGGYRLLGLGQSTRYRLFLKPTAGQPYLPASTVVDAGPISPSAVTHDLRLRRGVLVRGRVTDKATGLPVNRAVVEPYAFIDNPHVGQFLGYRNRDRYGSRTDTDGRFEIVTIPGRGLLTVDANFDRYLTAKRLGGIAGYNPESRSFDTHPFCSSDHHHGIAEINPEANAEAITRDFQLDTGSTATGVILDPEGREIGDLTSSNLSPSGHLQMKPQESARFEAPGVDPDRPRRVSFFHEGRKLAGSIVLPTDGPAVVRLQPWGVVTGRLVDEEGRPESGYSLFANVPGRPGFDPDRGLVPINGRIEIDRDGRFRIERLIPGLAYKVHPSKDVQLYGPVFEGLRVAPGETQDVGDVKVTPFRE